MAAVDVSLKFYNENVDYAEVTYLSMLEAWKSVFGVHFSNKRCIAAISFCLQQVKVYYTCQKKIAPSHESEYWKKFFLVAKMLIHILFSYTLDLMR